LPEPLAIYRSINALAESLFATLECELFDQQPGGRFTTRREAKLAVFDTSRRSTTPAAGTPPSACSHPHSSKHDTLHKTLRPNPGSQKPGVRESGSTPHARVEDRIRTGKDTGPGHLPSRHQNINEVWVELALIAVDLLALTQSMLLTDDPELHRAEPKTLRYRLLHTAARITRGQRKVLSRLAQRWPWALALAKAITRLRQIPLPA